MLSETSAFPFSAGNDRCFQEINGQKVVLKSANVCAEGTTGGPRLYFIYSATPKAACIIGSPATKEQYSWGLDALGPQEKAFFLSHIDSR